jgi:hypothetical protein
MKTRLATGMLSLVVSASSGLLGPKDLPESSRASRHQEYRLSCRRAEVIQDLLAGMQRRAAVYACEWDVCCREMPLNKIESASPAREDDTKLSVTTMKGLSRTYLLLSIMPTKISDIRACILVE